ncbi:alpha-1A adrenergic receptor-like [Lytechinus pictus]|uniref:alpha-1A adrenergic receptor-like n=1 Tax=Lytechinus pictus TaxID=7653 RepID=UPI0030B9CE15
MIITYLCRQEVRETSNWFTLASFATGEFMSCVYYPIQILVDIYIIDNNPACLFAVTLGTASAMCFTLNVLGLTVERYISICKPLRAPTLLTQRRIGSVILAIFIYSLTTAMFIPYVTPLGFKGNISGAVNGCRLSTVILSRGYVAFLFANGLLPIPAMIIIYCRIFQVLRRHIRTVSDLTVIQPGTSQRESGDPGRVAANANDHRVWKREAKSAVLLFIIVISFAVCWVPFVVFILYRSFTSVVSPLAYAMSRSFVFLNVAIHPFVYGFGNKTYRQAIYLVFCGPVMKAFGRNPLTSVTV